ncbi:hypothetical protein [Streptomyces sennicomposti]
MTTYAAVCHANSRDVIEARVAGDSVELVARSYGERKMETYLDVDKARIFARGILALADEIDGGEQKPADDIIKAGDLVRIVYAKNAEDNHGKLATVVSTDDGWQPRTGPFHPYLVDVDGVELWAAEVTRVGDTSEARVEASADTTASSPRARYVEEAKTLLTGTLHGPADIIRLAEFLATGE